MVVLFLFRHSELDSESILFIFEMLNQVQHDVIIIALPVAISVALPLYLYNQFFHKNKSNLRVSD